MVRSSIDDCWNRIGVRGNGSCPELERHVHCRNCPVHTAVAGALLDVPLPSDYRRFWAEHLAQPSRVVCSDTQAVLVFRIGAEWLALPASRCRQVVEMRPIHTLPSTNAGPVVIRADEIHRIERIHAGSLTPAPATVTQASATYTKGLFRCDEKSVGLLDDALLEHTVNRSLV
jgi:chemotaxis-related protein WspD